jgi:putative ABC transport system permease protein
MLLFIPISWLQLIHNRVRFIATLAGVSFVAILLFMQLGFQDAMFDSSVRVHKSLQGDLFIISTQYQALTSQQSFPRNRLYQTLALDEVESVSPLYFQFGKLKNIENGEKSSIFVFGINPGSPTFNLPEINQNLDTLKLQDAALFDRESRSEFGPITEQFQQKKLVQVEIAPFNQIVTAQRFKILGLFGIGTSFGVDGNIITNSSTFLRAFTDRQADNIDLGLIMLKPDSNLQKVQQILQESLPKDVKILSRQEFIQFEKDYWDIRTPVGFAFKVMVTMGIIVGIGIAYQILYSNIASHLLEYATLKAIGFANKYLLGAVFQQAVILAILGYLPGLIVSYFVYDLTKDATRLPVIMSFDKQFSVLMAVLSMCVISGFLAIQKLRSADPADIF